MFHNIPAAMQERMLTLESIDARDRRDNTPKSRRLRQITPETGYFLALMAAAAPQGRVVEIGTSAGYSTLWLALACRQSGRRITTFEVDPAKVAIAQETFELAGVKEEVEIIQGDARELLPNYPDMGFCFLDAEKELYLDCYEAVVPHLRPGGLLVADNAISHAEELEGFITRALADPRVDAMVIPVGKGELVARKL
jgi:caffeoyl-CoA O-methyltransferase